MVRLPLKLEHALLGFAREQPTHAYEIYQRLAQSEALGLVWRLKQSQLYALLTRLEEAGYLLSSTEVQGNRPPRKMLALSPSGRAAFLGWLETPVEHGRDFRQEFLAKLYFAQNEGQAAIGRLLEGQRSACQGWIQEMQAQRATLGAERLFDDLVLQFRIGQVEAILSWLEACSTTLRDPDRP